MFSQVRQGDLRILPKNKQNKSSNKLNISPDRFNATPSVCWATSLDGLQSQGWLTALRTGRVKQSLRDSPASSPILLESQVLTRWLVAPLHTVDRRIPLG